MSNEDELTRFVNTLYEGLEGYVYGAWSHKPFIGKPTWTQRFFEWPDERNSIIQWALDYAKQQDVYLAPSIFNAKNAHKEYWKETNFAWVEIDSPGVPPEWRDIQRPAMLVQSSNFGNFHAYWRVPKGLTSENIESINRALMRSIDGADATGFDCNQVLRPPGTINHKPGKNLPVVTYFVHPNAAYLDIDTDKIVPKAELVSIDTSSLPPSTAVLSKYLNDISKIDFLTSGYEKGKRSSALMRLAYVLAECQAKPDEIFSVVLDVDNSHIHKFDGRADQLQRINEIVTIAITKTKPISIDPKYFEWQEAQVIPPDENDFIRPSVLLAWTEDNVEFLWHEYLIDRGLIMLVGPPGVGKTQWAYFVASHLALGLPILDQPSQEQDKIGFLSLEMGKQGMRYVIEGQRLLWDTEQFLTIDERLRVWPVGSIIDMINPENRIMLEEKIERHEFKGLIVDTFATTTFSSISNEEITKAIFGFFSYLREKYGIFIWLNHHNRKAGQSGFNPIGIDDIYGARYIQGQMDTIFTMQETEQGDIELAVRKARYSALQGTVFTLKRGEHLSFEHSLKEIEPTKGPNKPLEPPPNKDLGMG